MTRSRTTLIIACTAICLVCAVPWFASTIAGCQAPRQDPDLTRTQQTAARQALQDEIARESALRATAEGAGDAPRVAQLNDTIKQLQAQLQDNDAKLKALQGQLATQAQQTTFANQALQWVNLIPGAGTIVTALAGMGLTGVVVQGVNSKKLAKAADDLDDSNQASTDLATALHTTILSTTQHADNPSPSPVPIAKAMSGVSAIVAGTPAAAVWNDQVGSHAASTSPLKVAA